MIATELLLVGIGLSCTFEKQKKEIMYNNIGSKGITSNKNIVTATVVFTLIIAAVIYFGMK